VRRFARVLRRGATSRTILRGPSRSFAASGIDDAGR